MGSLSLIINRKHSTKTLFSTQRNRYHITFSGKSEGQSVKRHRLVFLGGVRTHRRFLRYQTERY